MKSIALVSLKGGAGRTTLAANLGKVIAERVRAVVVDLDVQNSLGLHFGMEVTEQHGLCNTDVTLESVLDYLRVQQPPVAYIPFGRCNNPRLDALEFILRRQPQWLSEQLQQLTPPKTELIILDTPAGRNAWLDQVLSVADMVLVVIEPDPGSYALLPDVEVLLEATRARNGEFRGTHFLLNRVDARRTLSRDIRDAFSEALGDSLAPHAFFDDEAVREALASRQTVPHYAPHAQFSRTLRDVADWVLGALEVA